MQRVSSIFRTLFALLLIATMAACGGNNPNATPSSKSITAYSILGVVGVINETNKTIAVTMPFGTSLTALVSTFTTTGNSVAVGTAPQISGTTANNFSAPVVYTVTAADGSTVSYTATVTVAANTAKAITAFSLAGVVGTINETNKTILATMPFGTSLTALVSTFTTTGNGVAVGAMPQISGTTTNNFSAPVVYTVTAADGSTASYTATVTAAANTAKAITAFSLAGVIGTVNETNKTIAVTMPFGTNITALVSTFTTTGNSVAVGAMPQISGTTTNNFSAPVVYTVTAADGSTASYTATVTVAANTAKAITAFSLAGVIGTVNETNKTIAVTMPFGTNITALVSTFTTTGNRVAVGATTQISGTTANNFSAPVVYTVTAADGSTANYTVTITVTAAKYTVGGSLNGLAAGNNIVLQNNGADNLTLTANGAFTFATPINNASSFNATILTLPTAQPCTSTFNSGVVSASNVASVNVFCGPTSVGTFTPTASLTTARFGVDGGTVLPNGKLLISGGMAGNGSTTPYTYLTSSELYDPAANTWAATGSLTAARTAQSVLLPNGKVLVAGGAGGNPTSPTPLTSTELYDPVANTWSAGANLLTGGFGHKLTLLLNGFVLIEGGVAISGVGGASAVTTTAQLYNSSSNTWSYAGNLTTPRNGHSATLLPNGDVLVVGGQSTLASGSAIPPSLTSAEIYHPATNTWSATGSLSNARAGHTATLLPNGKVLVVGGQFLTPAAELYDPATGLWTSAGTLATARTAHTATLLPNGKVLITGGNNGGIGVLATSELYDPATNTWSTTGSMNTARDTSNAVRLSSGKVIVFGGSNALPQLALSSSELYW